MTTPQSNRPEALHHVLYEFQMLHWAGTQLWAGMQSGLMKNALLESFLVHARCIEEFFRCASKYPNTMKSSDFALSLPVDAKCAEEIKRMHKELAHLTYERKRSPEAPGWDTKGIARQLIARCLEFLWAVRYAEALMAYADNRVFTETLIQALEGAFVSQLGCEVEQRSSMGPVAFIPTSTSADIQPGGGPHYLVRPADRTTDHS